jgi:hypothetical protein
MYTMLCECVLTQKGKLYIRAHTNDQDVQAIWTNLCNAYEDSVSIAMESQALHTKLTLLRLDDRWKKTLESFMTLWSNKVIDLESIKGNTVDGSQKHIWLTNLLQSLPVVDPAIKQAIATS